jgi:hypothetical protein
MSNDGLQITPADERHIGCLAIAARLLYEEVLAWMEDQPWPPLAAHKPRKENAPMWRESIDARNLLDNALDDLLGLEKKTEVGPRFRSA